MQRRHGRVADLNGEVTARHHDAVAHPQNFFQVRNRFRALDFRNQAWLVFVLRCGHVAELARHFHIGGVFRKAHRHVVGLKAHRGLDVVHVLGREGRCSQAAALFVDALVVGQLTAKLDGGDDFFAENGIYRQHDQAVIEQQYIACPDITRQLLVVQPHTLDVARFGA